MKVHLHSCWALLLQPYVPGSPRAVVASEDLPWWGGVFGREVTDRFVEKVMVSQSLTENCFLRTMSPRPLRVHHTELLNASETT